MVQVRRLRIIWRFNPKKLVEYGSIIVCWEFHSYGFTNEVDRQNISLEVQPPTTEVPLGAILETEKCSAGERNM